MARVWHHAEGSLGSGYVPLAKSLGNWGLGRETAWGTAVR